MSDQAPSRADAASMVASGEPVVDAQKPDGADLDAVVAELTAEVTRGRSAGTYPASLVARLETPFHPDEGAEPAEAHVRVESARPLRSTRPVVGGVTVFSKRVVRRLLSWYVAPIAQDQTRFNLAILREVRDLQEQVARLEGSRAAAEPAQGNEAPEQGGS
jgi:hypothetical protein